MTDPSRYPIPAGEHRVERTIQRSRFIATIAPAATIEEAADAVRRVSAEFADATHNCWAFLVGAPGSTDRVGMSDDGEPHGTAGRPMLNVLVHSRVGDIVAVVTRYYGGTKLGTGGLVRAYGGSVQQALDTLPLAERVDLSEVTVVVAYPHVSALQTLLPAVEAELVDQTYAADVSLHLRLPTSRIEELRSMLMDTTRGQGTLTEADAYNSFDRTPD